MDRKESWTWPDSDLPATLSCLYLLFFSQMGGDLGMDTLIRNAAMNLWRRDCNFTTHSSTFCGHTRICPEDLHFGALWSTTGGSTSWSNLSSYRAIWIKNLKNAYSLWPSNSFSRVCPRERVTDTPKALPTKVVPCSTVYNKYKCRNHVCPEMNNWLWYTKEYYIIM